MAKKKSKKAEKKTSEATAAVDAAVAETGEAAAEMNAVIEEAAPPVEEKLAEEVHEEVRQAELSSEEQAILASLKSTDCWMATESGVLTVYGPTATAVKDGSARVWRVLGQLRREKKIDSYPQVKTEIVTK